LYSQGYLRQAEAVLVRMAKWNGKRISGDCVVFVLFLHAQTYLALARTWRNTQGSECLTALQKQNAVHTATYLRSRKALAIRKISLTGCAGLFLS